MININSNQVGKRVILQVSFDLNVIIVFGGLDWLVAVKKLLKQVCLNLLQDIQLEFWWIGLSKLEYISRCQNPIIEIV